MTSEAGYSKYPDVTPLERMRVAAQQTPPDVKEALAAHDDLIEGAGKDTKADAEQLIRGSEVFGGLAVRLHDMQHEQAPEVTRLAGALGVVARTLSADKPPETAPQQTSGKSRSGGKS